MNIIVIPIYKKSHLCQQVLNGIRKHESGNVGRIIVTNNSPDDPGVNGCLEFWQSSELLPLEVINNSENIGFTLSANVGLRAACENSSEDDAVFLISNDVVINGKFASTASSVLTSQKCLLGHKLLSRDTGWNTFDGNMFPYIEGYFLACTSSGWKDLGYFDPSYAPFDFEDVDLSTTAISKGYKLVPTNNPGILHAGGGTIGYTDERRAITERNREYFRKKWISE